MKFEIDLANKVITLVSGPFTFEQLDELKKFIRKDEIKSWTIITQQQSPIIIKEREFVPWSQPLPWWNQPIINPYQVTCSSDQQIFRFEQ